MGVRPGLSGIVPSGELIAQVGEDDVLGIGPQRVDSGRGQNRTLRLLSALWPPVFAGEQDVWAQELGLDCQPGVFPLSDRFAETGGIPAPIGFGNET